MMENIHLIDFVLFLAFPLSSSVNTGMSFQSGPVFTSAKLENLYCTERGGRGFSSPLALARSAFLLRGKKKKKERKSLDREVSASRETGHPGLTLVDSP